ncbi:MAG: zinc finger domain-containing protein, partial [Candidatus Thermoplasmatota archaeon]|nr:zinc finger domain-containing protein [Candidatus Thermoplasmatota archaeon]
HFTAARFGAMLAPRRARLKSLLLNQRFLTGLGNIYVDESLHAARIHPLRTADTLSTGEVRMLHRCIRTILRAAITEGGTTIQNFAGPDGAPGRFRSRLRVFRRNGESCGSCGTTIERSVVAQRGTHFCPHCQRL